MLPYIFSCSSHLSFTLLLGGASWLSHFSYNVSNYFSNLLSHLVPIGTPLFLIHFIVLVELISLIIRPLTLAIRLIANMTSGHLILSLISMQLPLINSVLPLFFVGLFSLIVLELGVRGIQAYVYGSLDSLYSKDLLR